MSTAPRLKFTKHEVEVAVKVAKQSKSVKEWVKGQARFFDVDLNSEEGKEFYERESDAAARKLLSL